MGKKGKQRLRLVPCGCHHLGSRWWHGRLKGWQLKNMVRLETTLVPRISGPKLPSTLKSLSHPHLPHPNKSHPLINMGQGRQHQEGLMIFTWTWGRTSKSPVDVMPTPPNAQGALRIQKLLHFTKRCGNPPPSWRGIKPLQHRGESRSPSWAF